MTRFIIPAFVLALGACAVPISHSETQVSFLHNAGRLGFHAAFKAADKHCQQFGKDAVPSVSGSFRNVSEFKCE